MSRRKHTAHAGTKQIYIEDIIGSKIATSSGKRIGRVVDMLIASPQQKRIEALIYGRIAWLYRFHILHPLAATFGLRLDPHMIPWDAVERFDHATVWLKPGHERRAVKRPVSHPHI